MSPLSAPALTRRRDGRKAANPRRAGSPERDLPTPSLRETPGRERPVDVTPRRVKGEVSANQSGGPDGGGERPGGENLTKASTHAPARVRGARARTGNEALKPAASVAPHGERRIDAWNGPRAGAPRGVPIGARRTPWRGKPTDAPTPSGAGRDGGGRRDGGEETPDAAREAGGGTPACNERGSAVLSCVARHESPGEEASSDQPVRPAGRCGGAATGLCGGAEAKRGPPSGKPVRQSRSCRNPEGVETPSGSGATHACPRRIEVESPDRRATSGEGCGGAARRSRRSHHASSLWRAETTRSYFRRQALRKKRERKK
jgi:hypothetical protein